MGINQFYFNRQSFFGILKLMNCWLITASFINKKFFVIFLFLSKLNTFFINNVIHELSPILIIIVIKEGSYLFYFLA